MENSLAHYGVTGMKWGVHRTPEQLGRRTIKKGTKMYSTTGNKDEVDKGSKSVSYLKVDRDKRRGYDREKIMTEQGRSKTSKLYEKRYSTKEDLKLPSRDDVKKAVSTVIDKDKTYKVSEENGKAFYDKYKSKLVVKNYQDGGMSAKDFIHYKKDPVFREEYDRRAQESWGRQYVDRFKKQAFNKDETFKATMDSLNSSKYNREKVIGELKKHGFNAMVNEGDVGRNEPGGRTGYDPIIIFDSNKSLNLDKTVKVNKIVSKVANTRYSAWQKRTNTVAKIPHIARPNW